MSGASLPFGATLRGSPAGAGGGLCPLRPPQRHIMGAGRDVWVKIRASEAERATWRLCAQTRARATHRRASEEGLDRRKPAVSRAS